MNELEQIIDLLKAAIEAGQTITVTADDVNISTNDKGGIDVTINNPSISTEA